MRSCFRECYRLGAFKLSQYSSFVACALAASFFLFSFISRRVDGCGASTDHLGGIWPNNGGIDEWLWTFLNRIEFRNVVAPLSVFFPQYRQVRFAAELHDDTNRVALTIDDAVGRDWPMFDNLTGFSTLLDVLDKLEVKAMLFVIVNNASRSAQGKKLLHRAVASGHEIGNHGLHDKEMASYDRNTFVSAVEGWETEMRTWIGKWPPHNNMSKWFRPPKGLVSRVMSDVLTERNYSISLPDVWGDDSSLHDPTFQTRLIANAPCAGSVMLMHVPDVSWGAQILDVLPAALPLIRSRGFKFVSLTELFADSKPSWWRYFLSMIIFTNILLVVFALLAAASCCTFGCTRRVQFARRLRKRSSTRDIRQTELGVVLTDPDPELIPA